MSLKRSTSLLALALCALTLAASPMREFRSTWIVTAWQIDWPKNYVAVGKSTQQSDIARQKASLCAILDSARAANMNAVYLQVRRFCDAFYQSSYEPWGQYLTGTRGLDPGYDPLAYAVQQAHERGLELHAWVNPYAYSSSEATFGRLATDYSVTHPEWICYDGMSTILNPGIPEVREQLSKVIAEIVRKYDIDGVVMDDYFYFQSTTANSAAMDSAQYRLYNPDNLSRANWRVQNVNRMVAQVYDSIRSIKPYVQFCIAPPGTTATSRARASAYGVEPCPVGSDWQYTTMYSDPLAWYQQGIIDVMSPQCYWAIGSGNDFTRLTQWWAYVAAHFGRYCYPSQAAYLFNATEMGNQVKQTRAADILNAPGCVYYNTSTSLMSNNFVRYTAANVYTRPALVPNLSWKGMSEPRSIPSVQLDGNMLNWDITNTQGMRYAVYCLPADSTGVPGIYDRSDYYLGMSYTEYMQVPLLQGYTYAVAPVDRYGDRFAPTLLGSTPSGGTAAELVYPADASKPWMPCNFTWQAVSGAESYIWQVARDAAFTDIVCSRETHDPSYPSALQTNLEEGVTYWWRVRTRALNATDRWSAVRSFSGRTFRMLTPTEGTSGLSFQPTVSCADVGVSGAKYTFEFATSANFAEADIVHSATVTTTTYTVSNFALEALTTYYVRARVQAGDFNAVTAGVSFTTKSSPVSVPVLLSPADGAVVPASGFDVCWQEQYSNGFRVELSTLNIFAPRSTKAKTVDKGSYCTTYTDLTPGTYYLRVMAFMVDSYTDPCDYITLTVTDDTGLSTHAAAAVRAELSGNTLTVHAPALGDTEVDIALYTPAGLLVARSTHCRLTAGTATWTLSAPLPAGLYLLRLHTPAGNFTGKVIRS